MKLSSMLITIQAVLEDAGTKQWENEAVRDWNELVLRSLFQEVETNYKGTNDFHDT